MDTHFDELFNRTRLGEFLHRQNLIDAGLLEEALQQQKISGEKLGQILSSSGQLDQATIDHLLQQQQLLRELGQTASKDWIQKQTRFGTLLSQLQLVTDEQLREALSRQKKTGKALGEVLVESGHLSIQRLHDTLRLQYKLRRVLIAALIGLVTTALVAPSASFAEASVASAQISITLRFMQPMPVVDVSSPAEGAMPILTLDGVTLTPDSAGGYDLTSLEELPANAPSQSLDFTFDDAEQLPLGQGTMTLYMQAK